MNLDRAAHRVDDAAKLGEYPVAHPFHDAPVVNRKGGIDKVAAQRPQTREGAVFVGARKSAVTNHVGSENGRYFARVIHCVL